MGSSDPKTGSAVDRFDITSGGSGSREQQRGGPNDPNSQGVVKPRQEGRITLESSRNSERGSGAWVLILLLVVIVAGALFYGYKRNSSLADAFHSVKESGADARTQSRRG